MIERYLRSQKEECVWIRPFHSFQAAKRYVGEWLRWYNQQRPHQALGYLSPNQYREVQQLQAVA